MIYLPVTHSPYLPLTHSILSLTSFFFYRSGAHPDLHSFPTRRSSDLSRVVANSVGAPGSLPNVTTGYTFLNVTPDRKSTRLNSSHLGISYAVFCLKKKNKVQ